MAPSRQQTKYVLDTNVFIEAHQKYYAFDICPGFWSLLEEQSTLSRVVSIDRVKSEIASGDALANWAGNVASSFFYSTTAPLVQGEFTAMMRWVHAESYTEAAKQKFAKVADGWLVAFAKVSDFTVVTHETNDVLKRGDVPIPVLCNKFSVPWVDPYTMLRDIGANFT